MYFKRAHLVETQQNIELMTFAVTWSANIFVGYSVTTTFFRQITSFSDSFHYTKKQNNESGQNRLQWLEILEMLWSLMRLIFKTSSVTPDCFYVFHLILSFSTCSQSFKKCVRVNFWAQTSLSVFDSAPNQTSWYFTLMYFRSVRSQSWLCPFVYHFCIKYLLP